MNSAIIIGLLFVALGVAVVRAAWEQGARSYQIDLRIAHHQGRDLGEMVESDDGYGDE